MWWDAINNFLTIVGAISVIRTVIRTIWIWRENKVWMDNVRIEEYPPEYDFDAAKGGYPQFYQPESECDKNPYATQNLFLPQNTIIRNAVIKEVEFYTTRRGEGRHRYRTIHKVAEISPDRPLCVVLERSEMIARYKMEWKTEYGGKAEYAFGDNLRNGDNSLTGIQYHFGVLAKIRKILNLK